MSLQVLYVDLNSFFASVEQQLQPELRGRPVGVLPVMAETTCCIAASIEAKQVGIKTGTPVREARKRCPDIVFIQARPATYVEIHHRIVAAVESCTPVGEVLSIDEMACELMGSEREEARAIRLARAIKHAIYTQVGEGLHCSIGLAPNRFLAKTASNMKKPDGLTVIRKEDLPQCLYGLKLGSLTGIGRAMEGRLGRLGIHTIEDLCTASRETLYRAWGGVEGERFYAMLRGEPVAHPPGRRASLGHSHVLPPHQRDPDSVLAIAFQMLHKAAMRLRHNGYCAGALTLQLRYLDNPQRRDWIDRARFTPHAETLRFNPVLGMLWRRRPPDPAPILRVGISFTELAEARHTPIDLFAPDKPGRLDQLLDQLNRTHGSNTLYFGAAHHGRGSAPMRIAFNRIPELAIERDR